MESLALLAELRMSDYLIRGSLPVSRRPRSGAETKRTSRARAKQSGLPEVTTLSNLPDWQLSAACRDRDPDLWFPPEATSDSGIPKKSDPPLPGQVICHGCPVEAECGEWAIATGIRYGIYGGMLPGTRERRRKALMYAARDADE